MVYFCWITWPESARYLHAGISYSQTCAILYLLCLIYGFIIFMFIYYCFNPRGILIYLFQHFSSWFKQNIQMLFVCFLLAFSLLRMTAAWFSKKCAMFSILKIFNIFFKIEFQPYLKLLKKFRPGEKFILICFIRHFHFSGQSFIDFQYSQLISLINF